MLRMYNWAEGLVVLAPAILAQWLPVARRPWPSNETDP